MVALWIRYNNIALISCTLFWGEWQYRSIREQPNSRTAAVLLGRAVNPRSNVRRERWWKLRPEKLGQKNKGLLQNYSSPAAFVVCLWSRHKYSRVRLNYHIWLTLHIQVWIQGDPEMNDNIKQIWVTKTKYYTILFGIWVILNRAWHAFSNMTLKKVLNITSISSVH